MDITDMYPFFKGIVDSEDGPIVICNLEYRIIYINPSAYSYYPIGSEMVGKKLEAFMDEEMLSKVTMTVEWFKESENNNRVFALRDSINNLDMYILAIRDREHKLIGFYGRHDNRTPDSGKEFDID